MPKYVAFFAATAATVQQTMKELPQKADLGNGIRQYAHFFSDAGKMCCVFEAPSEAAIRLFLNDKQPVEVFPATYEWDRATGKFRQA